MEIELTVQGDGAPTFEWLRELNSFTRKAWVKAGYFKWQNSKTKRKYGKLKKLARIAYIHEKGSAANTGFRNKDGTPSLAVIPPRPFMEPTFKKNKAKYAGMLYEAFKLKQPIGNTMEMIGRQMQDDIKATLYAGNFTPLKPSTVSDKVRAKKKGVNVPFPSKPLSRTQHMLKSVTHLVWVDNERPNTF